MVDTEKQLAPVLNWRFVDITKELIGEPTLELCGYEVELPDGSGLVVYSRGPGIGWVWECWTKADFGDDAVDYEGMPPHWGLIATREQAQARAVECATLLARLAEICSK